ncbi:MAG: alkylhydroperoxidase [Chloroflexi bacterium]|jgi:AhpD family alkylhydroperoxidase|nr:alkylhydroperoxidase [Chloroflexota bacterium]MQG54256.1 carboxymuconolactone decarboxylase family protein [SAR202 cluster bacterium]|tara:strand:+ start:7838 stop:8233 length:396 start_codon:yes stop_codon:yes gene_type:complete
MPQSNPVHYADAGPVVRAVYDDIKTTRGVDDINNFWKHIANHPPTLKRTWESVKQAMAPGALDLLVKEMVFVAVSASNGCEYCLRCHTDAARKQGMTDKMLGELIAVVGVATQSNILANGYQIPLDDDLKG